MRARTGAAALLLLAVLTGCSDSTTDDRADPAARRGGRESGRARGGPGTPAARADVKVPDPCTLVTQQEAATALGVATDAHRHPGRRRSAGAALVRLRQQRQSRSWCRSRCGRRTRRRSRALKGQASAGTAQDVSGLGDAAFLAAGTLYVHKGSLAVSVFAQGLGTDAAAKPVLTSLATAAVGRL